MYHVLHRHFIHQLSFNNLCFFTNILAIRNSAGQLVNKRLKLATVYFLITHVCYGLNTRRPVALEWRIFAQNLPNQYKTWPAEGGTNKVTASHTVPSPRRCCEAWLDRKFATLNKMRNLIAYLPATLHFCTQVCSSACSLLSDAVSNGDCTASKDRATAKDAGKNMNGVS